MDSRKEYLHLVLLAFKRFLVFGGLVVAIYVAIGSILYGVWWFGFFWRGEFQNLRESWDSLLYGVQEHPYTTVVILVLGYGIALFVYGFRSHLLPFMDRHWAWLVSGSFVAIGVTALLVYAHNRESYELMERVESAVEQLTAMVSEFDRLIPQPDIKAPIDFHFIDATRVEALYNQVEPELVEKRRTIARKEKLGGKAEVATGPVALEGEAGRENSSTGSFERIKFSPERKCVEVMNFVIEEGIARYYTAGSHWFLQQLVNSIHEARKKAAMDIQKPVDLSELRRQAEERQSRLQGDLNQPDSEEERAEASRRLAETVRKFNEELRLLNGLVLVDGEFSVHRRGGNVVVLKRQFAQKPRSVVFQVVIRSSQAGVRALAGGRTNLRVFGTVSRPLSDDGVIEIRPIAVF